MGLCSRVGIAVLLLLSAAHAEELELRQAGAVTDLVRVDGKSLSVEYEAPEGTWSVRAVRLWGRVNSRRGGSPFEVKILDAEGRTLARAIEATQELRSRHSDWIRVELPVPPSVAGRFRVVVDFRSVTTFEVSAGFGRATDPSGETHSWITDDEGEEPFTQGTWCIHPVLVDDFANRAETGPEGASGDFSSLEEGRWRCVRFKRPSGTWWLHAVRVYLRSSRCPREDRLCIRVMTGAAHTVHLDALPILGPHDHEGWVEVPIRAAIRAKSSFRLAVCRTGTEGWVSLGQVMHEASTSSFDFDEGRPRRTSALPKGRDYRIRAVFTTERPSIAGVETWLEDLEYVLKAVKKSRPLLEPAELVEPMRKRWRKVIERSLDDREHLLAMMQVIAELEDGHARLTPSDATVRNPAFDGLDGAGLWIAWDRGRMTLRGMAPDHPLADRLKPGAVLTRIDGRAARLVNAEVLWRLRRWLGWSTRWQLQAALGTRFFPFGEREELPATFLGSGGEVLEVVLQRLGPPPVLPLTLPPGIEAEGKATAGMLDGEIGYLRILGGMNEETTRAFDAALEKVKKAKALVLDARGAGDGEDGYAAEMAGRFLRAPIEGGRGPVVRPRGPWRFEGTLVLLLDERMAGAAEAFTWMLSAGAGAVTVGGPTAGSILVPTTYRAPSRLFTFTLGHPVEGRAGGGLLEEGDRLVGEVPVGWWPGVFERHPDPPLAIGTDILRLILAGVDRTFTVRAYAGCLQPNVQAFATARRFKALEKPQGLWYADLYDGVFKEHTHWLRAATEHPSDPMPAYSCAAVQIMKMGIMPPESWGREVDANELWNDFVDLPVELQPLTLPAFLLKYGTSRYGEAIRADPVYSARLGD